MPLRLDHVTATSGQLRADLFENRAMGVPRGLYWNLRLDCIATLGERKRPNLSFAIEWLTFDAGRFADIAGATLANVRRPAGVEASLYGSEHHPVQLASLEFGASDADRIHVRVTGAVRGGGPQAGAGPIALDCDVCFDGVSVVPGNLFPKPGSLTEARAALSPYFDVATLDGGELQDFKYVFAPLARTSAQSDR